MASKTRSLITVEVNKRGLGVNVRVPPGKRADGLKMLRRVLPMIEKLQGNMSGGTQLC